MRPGNSSTAGAAVVIAPTPTSPENLKIPKHCLWKSILFSWTSRPKCGGGNIFFGNGFIPLSGLPENHRHHGFSGNIKKLWAELDANESGYVTLEDIHPVGARTIKQFYDLYEIHYLAKFYLGI